MLTLLSFLAFSLAPLIIIMFLGWIFSLYIKLVCSVRWTKLRLTIEKAIPFIRIFNSVVLNSRKCYSIHHWKFPKIEWNCLCRFRLRTKHYSWNCKFVYSDFPNFIVTIFISTTGCTVYLISSFVPPFYFILLIRRIFLFIAKFCCMKAVAICLRKLTQYTTSKQRMTFFKS